MVIDRGPASSAFFEQVASTTGAIASAEAKAMKDVGATWADDHFVAERENHFLGLTLFADEAFRAAELAIHANVTHEGVVDFLQFRF